MPDRAELEAAAGAVSLGMLADDASLAVIRYLERPQLEEADRHALKRIRDVLTFISGLATSEGATPDGNQTLQGMSPLGALEGTLDAVSTARMKSGDLSSAIAEIVRAIDAVLSQPNERESAEVIRLFFQRLAEVTLEKSEEFVRPSHDRSQQWTRAASLS